MRSGDGVDEKLIRPHPLVSHLGGPLVQHPFARGFCLAVEKFYVTRGMAVHLTKDQRPKNKKQKRGHTPAVGMDGGDPVKEISFVRNFTCVSRRGVESKSSPQKVLGGGQNVKRSRQPSAASRRSQEKLESLAEKNG